MAPSTTDRLAARYRALKSGSAIQRNRVFSPMSAFCAVNVVSVMSVNDPARRVARLLERPPDTDDEQAAQSEACGIQGERRVAAAQPEAV